MLFPPPKDLMTSVFARLPDKYRITDRPSSWAKTHRASQGADCVLEGPSFDRKGNLYVVDVAYGRVFKISPDGREIDLITEYDGEPNGLKIHQDGRIFIADFRHGIMILNPESGAVTPYLVESDGAPFKGVNDLIFASTGDLYFTDQGLTGLQDPTGRLYRYSVYGELKCLLDTAPSPNGLALNEREDVIYLNVTRANAVWRVPLAPGGGTMKVGAFIQLSGGHGGPDGLAVDEAGNLVVAHIGMGSVWVFSPLGEPLYRIRSCRGLSTTNVAYGGKENKTLYITESDSGCVLSCQMEVRGRDLYAHM